MHLCQDGLPRPSHKCDRSPPSLVTLFGCDCPPCINALRQLRRDPLLNKGQGYCWTSLEQEVSQQEIQDVLQSLEAEEANQGGL